MATPREIVLAYYDAVDAGDNEALLAMFHPEAVYRRGGYPPIEGAAALRHFYENVRIIAKGEHAVDSAVWQGEHVAARGTFRGLSRDDEDLSAEWADFFTFEDGLIRHRTTYFFAPGV
ncbi:nuclear transport factor 2 family protein [Actinomadura parmotrematis]|uniref:Nuclear transport factor 2 family protein n=1 Tax=Actinomadura parmotrematis TaxID=2864039 RepID=A0ABS7G1D2_9ACTN|nr:nuclear transport factor 2 family protein [Actinomadura parmotrematis]MBW8485694.1 nuclear transport factor 2 family protein [Actinomadura parmotrematis]